MKTRFRFAAVMLLMSAASAQAKELSPVAPAPHPDTYDDLIAEQAKRHGVPELLVHRIVMRESRYHPDVLHRIYYGLMQITYATARSMGYNGKPRGLLDAKTNLTYGVPYLANAYIVAEKNEDRAVALYAGGYYFEAKRQHKLALLRTASSEPIVPPPVAQQPAPEAPSNPVARLLQVITTPLRPVPPPAPAEAAPDSDAVHMADTAPIPASTPAAELPQSKPETESKGDSKASSYARKMAALKKTNLSANKPGKPAQAADSKAIIRLSANAAASSKAAPAMTATKPNSIVKRSSALVKKAAVKTPAATTVNAAATTAAAKTQAK